MNKLVYFLLVLVLFYIVIAPMIASTIRHIYKDHGKGDQLAVFFVVFGSFASPILAPFIHIKNVMTNIVLPNLGLSHLETPMTYFIGRLVLTPKNPFNHEESGPKTDYNDMDNWSMLPGKPGETGQLHPSNSESCKVSDMCEAVDTFYLHPTTWYTSASWNAPSNHPVTNYLSDDAIGPQQAGAFNIASRVFAPRYRQMSAAAFLQHGGLHGNENSKKALAVAWEDVKNAFQHYLDKYNPKRDRGIILAGHSQGSVLAEMIVREFFIGKDLASKLVAAYLPGWTIFNGTYDGKKGVGICQHEEDTQCVISWRTYQHGGDDKGFLYIEPPQGERPICHNPLSWKENDGVHVPKSKNLGSLDLMHPWTMWNYIKGYKTPAERVEHPALSEGVADATCINGSLFIEPLKSFGYGWFAWPAWTFASFPGLNSHPYDFNLFFENVRRNARDRAKAWLKKHGVKKQ